MDKSNAKEIIHWARADFERHRHETNIVHVRSIELHTLLNFIY